MATTSLQPRWRSWVVAIRPRTLPAAVSPVIVGTALALADGLFAPIPAAACLLAALLIQIASNVANDYFDYIQGVDTAGRKGPVRAAQSGLISPNELRLGLILVLAAACLVGLYLVTVGGWPILLIGIASIISALAYSGGPAPVGYHGLGDLFVFVFFGLAAVCGTYYVQALRITPQVIAAAIPIGALITAILVVNNLRDIETDRAAGKRSLAVIIGPHATRLEYVALLALAYLSPLLFVACGWSSGWVLLPWLTAPLAVRNALVVYQTSEGPPLNRALARTANMGLLYGALFSLGLLL